MIIFTTSLFGGAPTTMHTLIVLLFIPTSLEKLVIS